ncbi:MAG: zinc dependent phospholipase C family protein [Methylotenera sp.]|nr:zinc dependent phospholipase C family protein [Methylotenera sp.]
MLTCNSKWLKTLYWWLPCCLYSADANAWGLVTHLYFAQSLLWAMPLLDPKLQRAIQSFPDLVLAGACLPDLAIISHHYRHTHLWENSHHLLKVAQTDQETAIAIGYASHLYIDVIAHHHFVPAHEAMWLKGNLFTHITCEWAMDAHLAPLLDTSPKRLLLEHHVLISRFISPHFRCSENETSRALKRLALGDGLLRIIKVPHVIYSMARMLDARISKHFVYYTAKTQLALADIGKALDGNQPLFEPEQKSMSIEQLDKWRKKCLNHLQCLHPKPIQYFSSKIESEY